MEGYRYRRKTTIKKTQIREQMENKAENLNKAETPSLNIAGVSHSYFHSVIKKLPHSEGRVPYTYHHDYLRMNVEKFKGKSRSEVASSHSENEIELYAVALTQLLDELNFRDTMDLNSEDIVACKKAIEITENVVSRYNCG